ncbi:18091_t:CDS:2, partial [Cetraspora pellucida]
KKKLVDKLQDDLFYYGDDEDESIVEVVLDHLKNHQKILKDEDKNPDIQNSTIFNQIQEEVQDTIISYASVLSIHDKGEIENYEKSEEYKYLVNKESLRQYREYEYCIQEER